jgi:hypothetical protein
MRSGASRRRPETPFPRITDNRSAPRFSLPVRFCGGNRVGCETSRCERCAHISFWDQRWHRRHRPRDRRERSVGSTTPATRTAKRSRKPMVASLSMPYATSARAKNCLTIINSKWTNRSRARSKLRMHAIVAAQIAAAPCLIQVVNVRRRKVHRLGKVEG